MNKPIDQRLRAILATERKHELEWEQMEVIRQTEEAERQKYQAALPGNILISKTSELRNRIVELDKRSLKQFNVARFLGRLVGKAAYPISRDTFNGSESRPSRLRLTTRVLMQSPEERVDDMRVRQGWVFRLEADEPRKGIRAFVGGMPDRFQEEGVNWAVPLHIDRAIIDTETGHISTMPVYEVDHSNWLTDCPVTSYISKVEASDPLLPSDTDVTEHALMLVKGALRQL